MGVIGIGVGTAKMGRICKDKAGNVTEQSTARWDADPTGGSGEPKPWPLLVLVYVSGTGAVLGQFYCHGWAKSDFWPMSYMASRSCVPVEDLERYADGKPLYGWIVGEAEAYDTPSPLAEFGVNRPPMSWQYIEIPETEG